MILKMIERDMKTGKIIKSQAVGYPIGANLHGLYAESVEFDYADMETMVKIGYEKRAELFQMLSWVIRPRHW